MSGTKLDLTEFTGTEHYYNYQRSKLTDGIKYMAEVAGAYWLIDVILSHQSNVIGENFQVWELKLKENNPELFKGRNSSHYAVITCDDGNGNEIAKQYIPYTDFPQDIKIYYIDKVMLLPSEY